MTMSFNKFSFQLGSFYKILIAVLHAFYYVLLEMQYFLKFLEKLSGRLKASSYRRCAVPANGTLSSNGEL